MVHLFLGEEKAQYPADGTGEFIQRKLLLRHGLLPAVHVGKPTRKFCELLDCLLQFQPSAFGTSCPNRVVQFLLLKCGRDIPVSCHMADDALRYSAKFDVAVTGSADQDLEGGIAAAAVLRHDDSDGGVDSRA